ncbi:hypothetical protein [Mucilaginibacter arboris]|uniref:Magnesium citrate secondary transporter n=1 Tax=Mucilaginibacter arboris TaxID=2682090 RepID=A0A7K1SYV8_9SPHI|nr:hypothetical protein [Mucilaginibacter arboris]MVN22492.1 hypothetical protein [Mucilaginibacter arboris]
MKTLLNPWFVAFCLMWGVLYFARITHHPILYLNGHLGDFLAVPVIANLGLWFQRIFIAKRSTYVLKPGHVIFIVLYLSIAFEWLLPTYHPEIFTADWTDVLLYIIGGCFFFKWMNRPLEATGTKGSA